MQISLSSTSTNVGGCGHTPPVLCGHYLSVLAASHSTSLLLGSNKSAEVGDFTSQLLQEASRWRDGGDGGVGNEGASMVTIYLKQGFVVDGLLGTLRSCGEVVVLRDVEQRKTSG